MSESTLTAATSGGSPKISKVSEAIIRIAGNSQDGIQAIGGFLARLAGRSEQEVMTFMTIPSTISGGPSIFQVRIGSGEVLSYFDAQLALGQAYFAKGDYQAAIVEGHKAQKLRPNEQLVHTNLSRAYMKIGDKTTAEHHGLQARIASWKENMAPPTPGAAEPELEMQKQKPPPMKVPEKFPDMPWKKKSTGPQHH